MERDKRNIVRFIKTSLQGPQRRNWLVQLAVVELAVLTAFYLRFEFTIPAAMKLALLWAIVVWPLVKLSVSGCFGLHLHLWRYFSTPDLRRLILSNLGGTLAVALLVSIACPYSFPRSVIAIDFFLVMLFTAGAGAFARWFSETASGFPGEQTRALIYGAGSAGVLLLRESRQNSSFGRHIVGFVDDDAAKRGRIIQGVPIFGAGSDLQSIVRDRRIGEVLIALPSAGGREMQRIVEFCQAAAVTFRTMPPMSEIISNTGLGRQLRDVAVEDLLGRGAVQMDRRQVEGKLENRIALVTGAAGSIGAELCRQIAACRPKALVAFDQSESGLFQIECELRRDYPSLSLHAEVGSIQNRRRLNELCIGYHPQVIYHAAAYKHVPMMEANVFEAVENNVVGTFNVAAAAREHGVEDLVMISTDKAVHPTSVMGVTKRISELIVRSFQDPDSRHVSVRFGNVLGSNGSVLPVFKSQIAAGGPVTVTHPEMRRYFMTIPEAVQLVLQASVMGQDKEIFVLDMGAPVSIVDLARQLILLSGLKPDEDVRIEFTNPRPGEKLHEELNLADEEIQPTLHPKIRVFAGASVSRPWLTQHLTALEAACAQRDLKALVERMKLIVPDYRASEELRARMEPRRNIAVASEASDTHSSLERQRQWQQSLDRLRNHTNSPVHQADSVTPPIGLQPEALPNSLSNLVSDLPA